MLDQSWHSKGDQNMKKLLCLFSSSATDLASKESRNQAWEAMSHR